MKLQTLLLCTGNQGKIRELRELTAGLGLEILTPADVPGMPETVEDGDTFEANALKKAREGAESSGIACLADDSGLCVDALDGRPGVYSARFAGVEGPDRDRANRELLVERMADVPEGERGAAFRCELVLAYPGGEYHRFSGRCGGVIIGEERGQNGFGYDPVFLVPSRGRTMAEMASEEKHGLSHRGEAMRAFVGWLGA